MRSQGKMERFEQLDKIGFNEVRRTYIEDVRSVQQLVEQLLESSDGQPVGVHLFYQWLNERGLFDDWQEIVGLKKNYLRQQSDAISIQWEALVPDR